MSLATGARKARAILECRILRRPSLKEDEKQDGNEAQGIKLASVGYLLDRQGYGNLTVPLPHGRGNCGEDRQDYRDHASSDD